MKWHIWILSGALGFMSLAPSLAHAASAEELFQQARDAAASGNRAKLARALDGLRGDALEPWVEYYLLRMQVDEKPDEVQGFLTRHAGSLPAERLRSDWIKSLGKRGQFDVLLREAALMQPDQEAQCFILQARLDRQDMAALDDARPIWFAGTDLPEACRPVMDALVRNGKLDGDDVWERVRRLLEQKKLKSALQAANYLPDNQIPDARALDAIGDNPMRFLSRLSSSYLDAANDNRRNRETLLYAVARIAANDPEVAANEMGRLSAQWPAGARAYGWGQIALQGARRHMPAAAGWYAKADGSNLTDEQWGWWVRTALRANDWNTVSRVISRMPAPLASQPDWLYWQGRAFAALGRKQDAQQVWQRISAMPNFYGNLAAEELGQSIMPPPRATALTAQETGEAMANTCLKRALALLKNDVRVDGVKEWSWCLRGMNDRQLLAAADLAHRNDVYDRAISAADRTVQQHDYALRYLAPFREKVEPKAQSLSLDPGWVYGLMRQESRFVIQAKSSVGAQGLMQVMPATAAWVAKKIGLSSYHPKHAMDMDTNITLGTNYMKMVLSGLDNHPVLASAAYNAGPGRAKKWRADVPLEGAIYAECIPFSETRDYVKKVMSNSVYYSALFEGKPQSLKQRLGTIRPRGSGDADADALP